MRSTRRPPHRLERTLVLVLAGFIAVDLLLVLPAFASELRLDRLHPSLPIVNLRPLAASRARIADGLGEEFTAPVRVLAGELEKAGAKAFNAVLYEVSSASGNPPQATDASINQNDEGGNEGAPPLAPSPSTELTISASSTTLPSPTVGSFETSVVRTATSAALPKKTKLPPPTATQAPVQSPTPTSPLPTQSGSQTSTPTPTETSLPLPAKTKIPPPTSTPIPSYTQTASAVPPEPSLTMTPSQAVVVTATLVCTALPVSGCEPAPDPSSTPTVIPTVVPSLTPLPTHTQTAVPVPTYSGPLPAFPGAEGWGAGSEGGRGGRVIEVTNLNDSGPGSLRAAIEASGPRIVVFRVAGVIRLESEIFLDNPYITIAGQTAPGSGITVVGERLVVTTHDVIIRYLRGRGDQRSFLIMRPWNDLHDVIVDHCSASWAAGNIIGIWYGPSTAPDMRNITVQNCLIAEPLAVHPTGMMVGAERTESVDYLERIHHISVHHNLFVSAGHRNPRIKALDTEVINNVVHNWANRIGGSERASEVDWIGNYFKAGPMSNTTASGYLRHMSVDYYNWDFVYPLASLYVAGNVAPEQGYSDPEADNWWMYTEYVGPNFGEIIPEAHRRYSALVPAPFPVNIQAADAAYDHVISGVGANARLDSLGNWVVNRDTVDLRLLSNVQNGDGPLAPSEIDEPGDIGPIDPGNPYPDSDHDGMADEWEQLHCFDPNDPSDGPGDADGDGYTNIEEFINGTPAIVSGDCSG